MDFPTLPESLKDFLAAKPETGMGFQTGSVVLRDGRRFDDVLFVQGAWVTEARGFETLPFDPKDIERIEITHTKWKWRTK